MHFRVPKTPTFKTSLSANLPCENEFCLHGIQNHFHISEFAPSLALKQQLRGNSQMASSVCFIISNLFGIIILSLRPLKPEGKQLIISLQLTITPRERIGYVMVGSRGAQHRVGYYHLISNKCEWNYCFIKNAHKISRILPNSACF